MRVRGSSRCPVPPLQLQWEESACRHRSRITAGRIVPGSFFKKHTHTRVCDIKPRSREVPSVQCCCLTPRGSGLVCVCVCERVCVFVCGGE